MLVLNVDTRESKEGVDKIGGQRTLLDMEPWELCSCSTVIKVNKLI